MSVPRVSLIISTYNRGPRIARTLDSVLAQGDAVDEIIVVDDGSTDETAAWVRANYRAVKVVTKANGGTSSARNFGARAAGGDVLVFLDHDDELLPGAVDTLGRLLELAPEAKAAFTDHQLHDLAGGSKIANHHATLPEFQRLRTAPHQPLVGSARTYAAGALYRPMLHGNLLQQPWAVRRAAFLALGGFDEEVRYCEDWDLYLRLTAEHPVVVSDDVISIHYYEVSRTNLSLAEGQEEMHLRVLHKHLALNRWRDWRAAALIHSRIAMYYKAFGDRTLASSRRHAWQHYWKSFWTWPFDHVVAARVLLWAPVALRGA